MKWRTSAIYLLIFLLAGGYFYYFEVVQQERKETAERESRRAFTFPADAVTAIEITQGGAKPVLLQKEDKWRIVQPLKSDVDRPVFDGFFSMLRNTERERNLGPSTENIGAFGLSNPFLRIRVQAGGTWQELLIGEKNPTESARYAKSSTGSDVFLLSRISYEALNRGLKELRKKDVFTWQTDQVVSLDAAWQSGEKVKVERSGSAGEWQAAARPGFRIKKEKVENFLDELHWLRASDFLDAQAQAPEPLVRVALKLKDGSTSELKIANPDPATSLAVAVCSTFDTPIRISSNILNTLPKSDEAFADRSLLSWNSSQVRKIIWKTGMGSGTATWINEKTWGAGDANPAKPVKDSIPFRTLVRELDDMEYSEAAQCPLRPSEEEAESVKFFAADGKTGWLAWKDVPAEGNEQVILWLNRDNETKPVALAAEAFRRIRGSLAEMHAAMPPAD